MGSVGSTASTSEPNRTILQSEVQNQSLYTSMMAEGVERNFAGNLTRAVMQHPEEGSITQENYEFYNMNGRAFNSQMQRMKKQLEKQGYDVTIENVDRKSGGEYRLARGRGFQRTSVQHYTVRKISWKKKEK